MDCKQTASAENTSDTKVLGSVQHWNKQALRDYDTFIFDCDGVLYRSKNAVPGAARVINALVEMGKSVVFLTNSSAKSCEDLKVRLQGHDIPATTEMCITSSALAALYLHQVATRSPDVLNKETDRVFYLGAKGIPEELKKIGLQPLGWEDIVGDKTTFDDADLCSFPRDPRIKAVVVGMEVRMDYPRLAYVCHLLSDPSILFIGTNTPDITYPSLNNRSLPGGGAIIAWVELATGRQAINVGKPEASLIDMVLLRTGGTKDRTIMIGDRLNSDIQLGSNAGIASLLVLSGTTSLTQLQGAVKGRETIPTFFAGSIDDMD